MTAAGREVLAVSSHSRFRAPHEKKAPAPRRPGGLLNRIEAGAGNALANTMSFFNLYHHHFVRIAAAVPQLRVADTVFNAAQTLAMWREAEARRVVLTAAPGGFRI